MADCRTHIRVVIREQSQQNGPCTELDPMYSRIWPVQQEVSSAHALANPINVAFGSGNSTVLELEGNVPYWFVIAVLMSQDSTIQQMPQLLDQ